VNRDPFLRLALIACCSAYMLGVFVVWDWLGSDSAIGVLITGIIGARAGSSASNERV
jgi:hypothetical protein